MGSKETLKLLETKYDQVGEEKIPIKLTFRAMIDYESITGHGVQLARTTEEVLILFFCAAKAGSKSIGKEFKYDYEGFLDFIDEHPESLLNFYESLVDGNESIDTEVKKKVKKNSST